MPIVTPVAEPMISLVRVFDLGIYSMCDAQSTLKALDAITRDDAALGEKWLRATLIGMVP
jgi:hypothetical protein